MLEQKPWLDIELEGISSPAEFLSRLPDTLALEQFWDFVRIHGINLFQTQLRINGKKIIIGAKVESYYADVFLGWYEHTPLQFVAVKILSHDLIDDRRTATRLTLEKFFLEQQNATDPHHYWPSLVDEGMISHPLCDETSRQQIDCMVIELIPGLRLDAIIKLYPAISRNPAFAAATAMQVIHGLEKLHDSDLVHRDIKPENVLITHPAPRKPFVRLFDANILRFPDSDLTDPGIALGTLDYMPPEALSAERLDPKSDYYSLGCVLYEMISGHTSFGECSDIDLMDRHLRHEPQPLDSPLWPIISRLLAKNPRERYKTNEDVRRALQEFVLEDPELAEYTGPALL